ncbi:hypothetical protein JAB5_27100 [Janthinobacterium sp. HH103]|nr:hypothetical protein JAB2_14550 [Janthinobacterium sp. HH100]OEZ76401.1 hypothetical protein JAB5_27100 [Janthinobacterium sp. HH103]QOU76232.1 hypothetical protein JAB4_057320 [Janthinobacterium sp. HH102]
MSTHRYNMGTSTTRQSQSSVAYTNATSSSAIPDAGSGNEGRSSNNGV